MTDAKRRKTVRNCCISAIHNRNVVKLFKLDVLLDDYLCAVPGLLSESNWKYFL